MATNKDTPSATKTPRVVHHNHDTGKGTTIGVTVEVDTDTDILTVRVSGELARTGDIATIAEAFASAVTAVA